ncbi:O-antigen ligase family protein [Candidatus Izemoplasma sp. B36]|uniref:O-antigen ligase family protein n=1 Tax=Candidatus Izemoplasma sp. B36 TaxID=3242468 RepID=UPI003556E1C5
MTEKNFFTSLPYLIIISLATFFIWFFKLDYIGLPIYIGIIFVLSIFVKNSIYIIPFLLNLLFMISQTEWDINSIPLSLYIAVPALIVGFIIHIIKYRVNIFKGKFFLGVLLLVIAMLASNFINNQTYDTNFFFIIGASLLYLLIYGFFANTITGDNLIYLIRIFVILGVMIAFQVLAFYLQEPDVIHALETKSIDLGWGLSNFVATYLIMFIATITYFVKKYKLHIFWIVLLLFEVTMLLFTLSRAGIIAFIITAIFLILFMFIKYDHKLALLLNLIIGLIMLGIVVYFTRDYFLTIWERVKLFGLDDNGRIPIWEEAIATFKDNLIFGAGLFARSAGPNELRMFHNTILHILACFGIIGGLALLVQFISILRIFFYQFNQMKAILLIAIMGANIHGMVDNTYIMPQYMIIMFVMIAVVENANKIDKIRLELRLG